MENNNQIQQAEDRQVQISDYLQAPRKKRKNYVIFASNNDFNPGLTDSIVGFVRKSFPQLAISHPQTGRELARQFGRNISLLLIDHEFTGNDDIFKLIDTLKTRRSNEIIPVIFLTKNPTNLIESYHKSLLKYQAYDDYLVYTKDSKQKILSRIKSGIDNQNKRQKRRFSFGLKCTFFHLEKGKIFQGSIEDLSRHGAYLVSHASLLFREGDQLKISMTTSDILPINEGDFLKLSAKVRRVFIGGNHANVSFEYVSDNQSARLTKFLASLVSNQMGKETAKLKAKAAQEKKERS